MKPIDYLGDTTNIVSHLMEIITYNEYNTQIVVVFHVIAFIVELKQSCGFILLHHINVRTGLLFFLM